MYRQVQYFGEIVVRRLSDVEMSMLKGALHKCRQRRRRCCLSLQGRCSVNEERERSVYELR
jgi:hypothetical protein